MPDHPRNPQTGVQPSPTPDTGAPRAIYTPSPVPAYVGNPYIEALPPIRSRAEAAELMQRQPPYDPAERTAPTPIRKHLLLSVMTFRQPLAVHLDLEERFGRMIRWGYLDRNPIRPGFEPALDAKVRALAPAFVTTPPFGVSPSSSRAPLRSTGMTIIGMSGIGKSTAVEGVLATYPQVLAHGVYEEHSLTRLQIAWLKLDCPNDGSLRSLCINFFQTIDALLGTMYQKLYAGPRATVDVLLLSMARVAAVHGLGVLVIDEIQHLSQATPGGERRMLNFFVQLVNTIGVPVALVGTYKALGVLGSEFRQARRGSGQGDLVWPRQSQGAQWDLFVESLWRYQYTREETPLTPALARALYDESQGITDLAVKIYALAQLRAMTTGSERITVDLIESVAADSLRLTRPVINALRTLRPDDIAYLRRLEDVLPGVLSRLGDDIERGDSPPATLSVGTTPAPAVPSEALAEPPRTDAAVPPPPSRPRRRRSAASSVPPDSLRAVVEAGRARGLSAYQGLREAGLIAAPALA